MLQVIRKFFCASLNKHSSLLLCLLNCTFHLALNLVAHNRHFAHELCKIHRTTLVGVELVECRVLEKNNSIALYFSGLLPISQERPWAGCFNLICTNNGKSKLNIYNNILLVTLLATHRYPFQLQVALF